MKTNRRHFIQTMGAGAAGLTLGTTAVTMSSCASVSTDKKEDDGQVIFIGDNIAIAETVYGKVRGFIHKDIYNFLGIPYGADTNREKQVYASPEAGTMDRYLPGSILAECCTTVAG